MAPLLPKRESYVDIWMKGSRFRVRDESGRHFAEIIGDLSESSGLGVPARTMEEFMDVWSQSLDEGATNRGVTEFYGDLSSGKGWVYGEGQAPWPIEAAELAPAAEQILALGLDDQLEPRDQVTRLGRPSTEYHGFLKEEDQGIPYQSEVTRVVSPPYLLFSHVRDAQNADRYYTREVVSLEEGAATDTELTPP
jgi:hypothetical protein